MARISWSNLASLIASLRVAYDRPIDAAVWEAGAYRPVPTIIEAALSLQSGLDVGNIAQSGAARHDVDGLTNFVHIKIEEAKINCKHVICFVTGVPGSGKTLVGLNLAFSNKTKTNLIHFLSGNGPLVDVLQTVLARHQMGKGYEIEAGA